MSISQMWVYVDRSFSFNHVQLRIRFEVVWMIINFAWIIVELIISKIVTY